MPQTKTTTRRPGAINPERRKAEEMLLKGYTIERVCDLLHKPYQWVRNTCLGLGLKPKRRPRKLRDPDFARVLIVRWNRGETVRGIAKELGTTRSPIWYMLQSLKQDEIIK